jgi:DNA polymerase-3 subunit delta'
MEDTSLPEHSPIGYGFIGNRWAVDLLLERLRTGRLGHAYLITGPDQVGKTTLARWLAQAFNCIGERPPCWRCRPCDLIARGIHPDVHLIQREGRSIKIEAIRALQQIAPLRPLEARCRIAIIRNLQDATPEAQDALLKTLEEPPASMRLLLTADSADKLLATIVSRCQVVPLRPVSSEEIAEALIRRYDMLDEEARILARVSDGRPGWAISAVEQPELLNRRKVILDDLIALLHRDRAGRFAFSEDLSRQDDRALILGIWQSWWRDVLLLVERSQVPPINVDRLENLEYLAGQIHPEEARRALQAVRQTLDALNKNANARLALDILMLDLPTLNS